MLGPMTSIGNSHGPTALGISPEAISAFIDEVNLRVGGLHSMILLQHGKLTAEAWWAPYERADPHMLYSLSKSFTSTAIGLAISEGHLTVEDMVVSFFPDKLPATVSANLAAMRVKDLLTMTTGHDKEPGRDGPDWVKIFLAAPVDHEPGTHFLYNSMATHVLAAIVQKQTGQRVLDYLTPRLFKPLGIEGPTWEQSPVGVDAGGWGLSLRTDDIAKFGQMLLQKGQFNGKKVVPAAWVEEATKRQVSNGDPNQENDWSQGYCYQFWRCQHGHYRGDGAFGQYCIVMPAYDAVLAITSGVDDMGAVLKAVWTKLCPGFIDHPSSDGEGALKMKLKSQIRPAPSGIPTSPMAKEVGGKTYKLETNPDGYESLHFNFENDRCIVDAIQGGKTIRTVFGTDHWIRDELAGRPVGGRGAWTTPTKFTVQTAFLDSPHAWNEYFEFDGDNLTVGGRAMNVWFGPSAKPVLVGKRG